MKLKLLSLPILLALAACGQETTQPPADAPAAEQETVAAQEEAEVVEEISLEREGKEGEAQPVLESAGDTADEGPADDRDLRLAGSGGSKEQAERQFTEGRHYSRLTPTQPTVTGGDAIEVAEVFWYGCGHCANFDPYINRWSEKIPADVRFVRIPAVWNRTLQLHAQAFYTAEVLARSGRLKDPEGLHTAFFTEIHVNGNMLNTEAQLKGFFGRFGVDDSSFDKAWGSFEVDQKLRRAADLNRRYGITGVPAVVVNGKYVTGGEQAGGYERLLDVIDELVAIERS